MTTQVVASNLGGGIARHLGLVGSVVPVEVHELSESTSLPTKVRATRSLLRSDPVPLVVTHGVAAATAVRHRGRRLRGVRHVEFWHGDPFFLAPRRRLAYRALAVVGRAPDLQVFTHPWLIPIYGDRRSRVEVLPNTVPLAAEAPRPGGGTKTAVFLGRLSREKGLEDLLAAWPGDSAARGWRLEVHGTGPLVASPARPDGVTWHGSPSDPLGLLARADLVVIPSWTETGPYTACESMSVGTPFVGTRTGDMPEFLASGCGWAVPPRDVDALCSALITAQSVPAAELVDRGRCGRDWLQEHRPFAGWAAAVERIYAR